MIHTFKASHCGHTFEGAEGAKALELHMKAEHKRHPIKAGARMPWGGPAAPGWRNGEIEKPTHWKAPRPTPGGLERVAERIAAGEYRFEVVHPNSYRESISAAEQAS